MQEPPGHAPTATAYQSSTSTPATRTRPVTDPQVSRATTTDSPESVIAHRRPGERRLTATPLASGREAVGTRETPVTDPRALRAFTTDSPESLIAYSRPGERRLTAAPLDSGRAGTRTRGPDERYCYLYSSSGHTTDLWSENFTLMKPSRLRR